MGQRFLAMSQGGLWVKTRFLTTMVVVVIVAILVLLFLHVNYWYLFFDKMD